jgi:predicted HTH transcriptional regulator
MSYLQRKIAEGEHQQQDFKFQISDSRKIARTLSAFANTDGGRLLIGVKDNGKINGVRGMEEVHMVEGAAEVFCTPEVDVEYHFHEEDGKQVVEALVQPSDEKPHFVKEQNNRQVAYFRRDDENFPANNVLIKYWKHPKIEPERITFEEREKKLISFLHENPFITVKRFAHLTKLPFRKAEDLLATFMRWGIIDWDYNGRFFEYYLAEEHKDD